MLNTKPYTNNHKKPPKSKTTKRKTPTYSTSLSTLSFPLLSNFVNFLQAAIPPRAGQQQCTKASAPCFATRRARGVTLPGSDPARRTRWGRSRIRAHRVSQRSTAREIGLCTASAAFAPEHPPPPPLSPSSFASSPAVRRPLAWQVPPVNKLLRKATARKIRPQFLACESPGKHSAPGLSPTARCTSISISPAQPAHRESRSALRPGGPHRHPRQHPRASRLLIAPTPL